MNNEQFHELFKEARKLSGLSTVELVTKIQKTQSTILSIISGRKDNTMPKIMEVLYALGFQIVVTTNNADLILDTYDKLHLFVVELLTPSDKSLRDVSGGLNVSPPTVMRIRKGGPLKLSTFLNILEVNNYTLRLDAIGL